MILLLLLNWSNLELGGSDLEVYLRVPPIPPPGWRFDFPVLRFSLAEWWKTYFPGLQAKRTAN
jgi:hypothetical protein